MDIAVYKKLNEGLKVSDDERVPLRPLEFKTVAETETAKTGIRFLTVGWHDKVLYGIARMKIFKAPQVDNPSTWEMGVDMGEGTYQTILHMHVSKKGIVVISKKIDENPKVWYLSDINSAPILRHEFVFSPITDTLNGFNITSHSDGINDYIIACQYGMGTDHVRNMYLSKDMGATWTIINTSPITTPGDLNSHWHTAKFDPYMGRIWASQGDNSNSAISYSDDLGETWTRIVSEENYQPTLICPFPKRVIFGRDRVTSKPGLDEWIRPQARKEYKDFKLNDCLSFRLDENAPNNYPGHLIPGYGKEAYVFFPARANMNDQYIYGTGDGGESWHCVYNGKHITGGIYLGNPSGVTGDGKIAFPLVGYGSDILRTPLVFADVVEWI